MKNQTKLKKKDFAVIFDMDGVIFDTQKLIFASEKILFKKLNLNIADTEHHAYAGKTSWELWRTLKQKYDLPQTLEELVGTHRKFGFEYIKNKKPAPIKGTVKLLNSLKQNDIKTALATSGWKKRVDWMIDGAGLVNFFDSIVYGDDVDKSKPHPDLFLLAAKNINALPEKCIVIEDSSNGLLAAKKGNMVALMFKNSNSGNQNAEQADFVFENFCELNILLLKKWC